MGALEERGSEGRLLKSVCEEAQGRGVISENRLSMLSRALGKRFENAYKAIEEGRVKKYVFNPSRRVVWIVVGRERDYQIIPESSFCTCDDFYFQVIDQKAILCYHLIAQTLAEALDRYETLDDSDDLYEPLMREWRAVHVTKRALPKSEIENVRKASEEALSGDRKMTIQELLDRIRGEGFDVLTTRHLAAILATDPRKRFKCEGGLWRINV